ncbi:hypothetical protein [Streptomyces sp. NBC_01481]|uniref:hypothetical protein n=1 Tax=Streptomyces sp. NBC_01481 TaxID=2975869 RepID=UPI0022531E3A|nr:hypothetical protein [Streptomyces sp. NBC_01481]MCX4585061.1 hypothetical protein [Streptomyces sp. NBC_01481]
MPVKTSTFAGHLLHFAQSVDIVDDKTFDRVRSVVYRYLRDQLDAQYCELLRESRFLNGKEQITLDTFWSLDDLNHHWDLLTSSGSPTNAATQAFSDGHPIWIASRNSEDLLNPSTLANQFTSSNGEIAQYTPCTENAHTVIVVPLRFKHSDGVLLVESGMYMEATDIAKTEISRLGNALAILYELYESNTAQDRNTLYAIQDLEDLLKASEFPRVAKPHFFVAFSQRADRQVVGAILDILDEFKDRAEFTDWSQMKESGSIASQISREISESKFGVCYFSEPYESDRSSPGAADVKYFDNPNVVFEAGMLHARTSAGEERKSGEPSGWIPIRELRSPPAPFDFSALRTLQVPRVKRSHELLEVDFKDDLRQRVNVLLGAERQSK